MIYLDNETTTKLDKEVLKTMKPYFRKKFAVPLAYGYSLSQEVGKDIEKARKKISKFIGTKPKEIRFTSGTTEANNLAIKGLAKKTDKKKVIISPIERSSIIKSVKSLAPEFEFKTVEVDKDGFVDLEDLKKKVDEETFLVSIQHSNQEIGTVQPIEEISEICGEVPLHSDITSSLGKFNLDLSELGVDLASFEADSIYGPKGIGALYIRKDVKIEDIIHGPEKNLRPGMKNIPAIIGFAQATEVVKNVNWNKIEKFRNKVIRGLSKIENSELIGPKKHRLPTNLSISFKGVEGEALMLRLDSKNIAIRTGSGCTYDNLKTSHVLRAISKETQGHSTIRMNFGKDIKKKDVREIIRATRNSVQNLREMSPVS